MTHSLQICQSVTSNKRQIFALTQLKGNNISELPFPPFKVLSTESLWVITSLSRHVRQGGKVSEVKVTQMRPHKVQPAGHEEFHPGFIRFPEKWHYVTDVQCSCLITFESATYSVSPGKRRPHAAGRGRQPINRDPLFQMCTCGGIVVALCLCTLLVAMSVWKQHAKTLWPLPITHTNVACVQKSD